MSQRKATTREECLVELRRIIHGWAFCNQQMLENKLNLAYEYAGTFPDAWQDDVDLLLTPLEKELSR